VEGATPGERTEVRLAYTARDLYVAFRCFDSRPDGIVATVLRRDDFALVENDQVVVSIDSYSDDRNGFFFSTNPLGVRVDAQFFDEGERFVDAWNADWQVATGTDDLGWTAEFRIPFSALQFRRAPSNEMGINLFRRIIRTNEELYAPLVPLSYSSGTPSVSVARKVVFRSIEPGRGFLVQPHLVTGYENAADGPAPATRWDWGGDARWNATSSLSARLSVRTDFAQVEADDRRINLTQYELFVPEKRDFFLENAGLYAFGVPSETELFFSRRIGLERRADGTTGEVPLRAGAKVSGRVAGLETGLLHVSTGSARETPPERFLVARFKRPTTHRSYVGAIATRRSSVAALGGAAFGVDGLLRLPHAVAVAGFAALTTDETGRARSSGATHLRVARSGERQTFHLERTDLQAGFDPAVGLVLRPASRSWRAGGGWAVYPANRRVRRWTPAYDHRRVEDRSGRVRDSEHRLSLKADLHSGDSVELFATRAFDRLRSDLLLLGRTIPAGEYTGWSGGIVLRAKPGRALSGSIRLEQGELYAGRREAFSGSVLWKASARLTIAQDLELARIRQPGDAFRARIAQLRADYSFDVATSLSSFLQYDNATDEIGARFQAGHILREGTELFLVYTAGWRLPEPPARPHRQALVLKATYGLAF
jgi:hypothetical protein